MASSIDGRNGGAESLPPLLHESYSFDPARYNHSDIELMVRFRLLAEEGWDGDSILPHEIQDRALRW